MLDAPEVPTPITPAPAGHPAATPATTPPTPTATPPASPAAGELPPWGEDDENFDAEKAKKLIANLRAQKNDPKVQKELDALRAKVAGFEDAARTEAERLEHRAKTAEAALAERDAAALRSEVALEKGLTASQAKRLVGTTREELTADAVQLLADIDARTPGAPSTAGQGNVGTPIAGTDQLTQADLDKLTAAKDYDAIEAARVAGRLKNLLSGTPTP